MKGKGKKEVKMEVGINLEFARSEKMSFEEGLKGAQQVGYRFVEPYVYSSLNLPINSHLVIKNESSYYHINTDEAKTDSLRELMDKLGLKFSALDVHTSLLLPQIGVPYLKKAIDLAQKVDCPLVISDEGPVPEWMAQEKAFEVMCISLKKVTEYAKKKGILFAIEPHNRLTTSRESLMQMLERFPPETLGVNFDTGNAFLAGNEPVEMLEKVVERVVQVHAKDIPESQLSERGKVTGTRVGVAVGDGMIDFEGVISVLKSANFLGVFSVECDTLKQAEKSLLYIKRLI